MTEEDQYKKLVNVLTKLTETVTMVSVKNELSQLTEKYSLFTENAKVFESVQSHASLLCDGPAVPPKGMAANGNSIVSNSAADLM